MSSPLLDLWESTWDSAVRTVAATGKALIGSHTLLHVREPNQETRSCWKPVIISSSAHRAARLKAPSMATARDGAALLCGAGIYRACRNKRGNKALFEHVTIKSKGNPTWEREKSGQTCSSGQHFSVCCFLLGSVLMTGAQPVLSCLCEEQKVIRGLPGLLHSRCLGWKSLMDSEDFLWEFLLMGIRICQTRPRLFFLYKVGKKYQIWAGFHYYWFLVSSWLLMESCTIQISIQWSYRLNPKLIMPSTLCSFAVVLYVGGFSMSLPLFLLTSPASKWALHG